MVIDYITTGASFVFSANITRLGAAPGIPVSATVCAEIVDPLGADSGSIQLLSSNDGADWNNNLVTGEFIGSQTSLLTPGRTVNLQISVDDGTTTDALVWNFFGVYSVIEGVVQC